MGFSIIWDIDGTLFDTYPAFVGAFVLALHGAGVSAPPPAPEVDALARVGLAHCANELASRFGLDAGALSDRFAELYGDVPLARQRPYLGAREICEAILRQGGLNAIATHRGRGSTERLLSEHGMGHLFGDIASVEEGFPKKPSPAMFMSLMERRGLVASRCVAVGDRDIDVLAGRAAGIRTCLYRGEPARSSPDFAFREYGELLRYLGLS